jgi:predicted nucleic acid-binding Zn ribbon protein
MRSAIGGIVLIFVSLWKPFHLSQEISIGQAIEKFLRKSRLQSGIQSLRIEEVWESVMGKTISKYTDKVQLVQGTLFVTTSVAPLRTELLFQKAKIVQRINEAMGEPVVKDVVVQ